MIKLDFFKEEYLDQVFKIESDTFKLDAWSKDSFIYELKNNYSVNIVSIYKSNIVGYIFTNFIYENVHINTIAVEEKFRKNNIAFNMLKYIINRAKKNNIENITLEVRSSNKAAISLYEKCGFYKISIRKMFYKNPIEDAIVMMLNI